MAPKRRMRPRAATQARVHGEVAGPRPSAWDAVYALVKTIPRGRVMTYGQIATLLESRLSPRAVGWALHGCPRDVPWQRVVNASGRCSTDRLPDNPPGMQRGLLEAEGVRFRESGALDLEGYRWEPLSRRRAAQPGNGSSTRTASRHRRVTSARRGRGSGGK